MKPRAESFGEGGRRGGPGGAIWCEGLLPGRGGDGDRDTGAGDRAGGHGSGQGGGEVASPLEDTAGFAPEPRFPHTIPQHCPASSTPKEPGQLHNAVSPAMLNFQSIRDAPKIQHGTEASLNPKEREQSSNIVQ